MVQTDSSLDGEGGCSYATSHWHKCVNFCIRLFAGVSGLRDPSANLYKINCRTWLDENVRNMHSKKMADQVLVEVFQNNDEGSSMRRLTSQALKSRQLHVSGIIDVGYDDRSVRYFSVHTIFGLPFLYDCKLRSDI